MKMDHLDNWIQRGLEAKAEQMNVSEDMEPRILQAVSARKREEHGRMKGFGKKIAAVAAAACLVTGTCYAAVKLSGIESHTQMEYTSFAQMEQAEEKAGFDGKFVESFQNGFTFYLGGTGYIQGTDENGSGLGKEYSALTLAYKNQEGKLLSLNITDGDPSVDAGEDFAEGYSVLECKFVPPDYELTEEDLAKQESGELNIAYGTETVEEETVESYGWVDDGLYYMLSVSDCDLGSGEMEKMAQEIMAAE